MIKVEAKYWFKTPYNDHKDQLQNATIILTINYTNNSYSITPACGTESFQFTQESFKWKLQIKDIAEWKAICKSIEDAIDFANNEINNN